MTKQTKPIQIGLVRFAFKQLRSVQEYYDRSMELLQGSIRAELFAAARPILAKEDDEASSYFAPGSRVKNSLVADGCTIEGSLDEVKALILGAAGRALEGTE